MISNYEKQYMTIVSKILNKGYYANNRTGTPTYKLPHQIITIDLQKEFPILKSKQVFFKTAVREILWIMQTQSNNIHDLKGHIWDQWADENGSIGKAYGYQVKNYHQIDNLINTLKNNPQDRRMMINLWNWADLPEMNLAPCCFLTMWDVTNGRLNCMLVQRSGDMPLGVPFNTTQYATLTYLLAQVTGLAPGTLTHVINNAHIYENQIAGIKEQIKKFNKLERYELYNFQNDLIPYTLKPLYNQSIEYDKKNDPKGYQLYMKVLNSNPKLKLNSYINDFYKFDMENNDIQLINYEHLGKIEMPVSV